MGILKGKAVIVTGAGTGLGRAYAQHAAGEGAQVVVNDLDEQGVAIVVDEITQAGGSAVAGAGSVSSWDDAAALVATCQRTFGRVDGLVNNAGVIRIGSPWEADEQGIRALVETNIMGATFVGVHALRVMVEQGFGAIVNNMSSAQLGLINMAVYGATKGRSPLSPTDGPWTPRHTASVSMPTHPLPTRRCSWGAPSATNGRCRHRRRTHPSSPTYWATWRATSPDRSSSGGRTVSWSWAIHICLRMLHIRRTGPLTRGARRWVPCSVLAGNRWETRGCGTRGPKPRDTAVKPTDRRHTMSDLPRSSLRTIIAPPTGANPFRGRRRSVVSARASRSWV